MLRPSIYPNLIGQAAMLEDRAFITMKHDDNPWAEGLVFTVILGAAVGIAGLIGGFLTSASLPPANALLQVILNSLHQHPQDAANPLLLESILGQSWFFYTTLAGHDSGWLRLLIFVWTPLGLVLQWLVSGFLVHLAAKFQGGNGTFNQTLGATSLMAAPSILRLFTIFPFVHVNAILLVVWSTLILFRAVQVAHDLPWRQAALAAVVPLLFMLLGLGILETIVIALLSGGSV